MNRKERIFEFHTMGEREVFDTFAALPGTEVGRHWVFLPGSRDPAARVLLVAHCDTVQASPPPGLAWVGGGSVLMGDSGTGSDDRAGCAMLWELRGSGHSLLLCDKEESGGIGASQCLQELGAAVLSDHAFAVEIDRRGCREWVTYRGTSSPDFVEFLREVLPDWSEGIGSFTDISFLCPGAGLCGVNIAAGYWGQHTQGEFFVMEAWEETVEALALLLSLPSYPALAPEVEAVEVVSYGGNHWRSQDGYSWDPVRGAVEVEPEPMASGWVRVVNDTGEYLYDLPGGEVPLFLVEYWEGQSQGEIFENDLYEWWDETDSAEEAPEDPAPEDPWNDRATWYARHGDALPY